ncbi:hypothetical protein EMIT0111MI5_120187 [Burkholderia sp. IT-111MI5]
MYKSLGKSTGAKQRLYQKVRKFLVVLNQLFEFLISG